MIVRANGWPLSRTPAAPGAANTSTFLSHWRGRAAVTRPGSTEVFTATETEAGSAVATARGYRSGSRRHATPQPAREVPEDARHPPERGRRPHDLAARRQPA